MKMNYVNDKPFCCYLLIIPTDCRFHLIDKHPKVHGTVGVSSHQRPHEEEDNAFDAEL